MRYKTTSQLILRGPRENPGSSNPWRTGDTHWLSSSIAWILRTFTAEWKRELVAFACSASLPLMQTAVTLLIYPLPLVPQMDDFKTL